MVSNYGSNNYYSDIVATTVSVLLGNGDGTFQAPQAFEAGSGPNDVAVGDFNDDGYQDLAVADYGPFTQRATTVSVLLGNGDGTFEAADGSSEPATARVASPSATSITTGGRIWPRATTGPTTSPSCWAAETERSSPRGIFLSACLPGTLPSTTSTAIEKSGPGRDRATGPISCRCCWATATGPSSRTSGSGPTEVLLAVALADFDGDGQVDLATANYFSTTISVLPGNGNGTFRAAQNFGVGMAPMGLAVGDFNRDGQPDLASGDYFSSSVSILINRTVLPQVATPALSPPGGTYTGSVTITITDAAGGATVHYTTDGTTPTSSSPVYTEPVSVTETTTIQAMAAAEGMADSGVASATYTIQQQAPTPAFSQPGGTYTGPIALSITIRDAASGATIHYTTDGTVPTTASPIYTGPIFIKTTTTIRTLAASSGMAESDVASATYTIGDAPPAGTPLDPWCVTTRWPRRQGGNECRQDWPPLSSPPGS